MINRLPWHKKLRTSSANNLDKINEIIDYINHSDISEFTLSENGSGRTVQAGKASSLKDLTVIGEAIQNGTPTPENPVPVQVVEGINGCIGLKIGETITPIDLQGNVLASLPDDTHDTLYIDSAGHVTIEKRVQKITVDGTNTQFNRVTFDSGVYQASIYIVTYGKSDINYSALSNRFLQTTSYTSEGILVRDTFINVQSENLFTTVEEANTWAVSNPTDVYYKLATPTTINLGYIEPPAIATDDEMQIIATITPLIDVGYWSYSDITELITDLKAYVDYKTTE